MPTGHTLPCAPCRGLGQRPKSLCRSISCERCERPKAARNASLRTPYRSPHHLTPPLYPRLYLHPHKKEGPFRPSLRFTCNEPHFLLPDGRSQRSRFVLRHRFLGRCPKPRQGAQGSVCPVGTWAEGPKRPAGVSKYKGCARQRTERRYLRGQRNHARDRQGVRVIEQPGSPLHPALCQQPAPLRFLQACGPEKGRRASQGEKTVL